MTDVFSPGTIGGRELPCRVLRAATHEGLADGEGRPLAAMAALYARLARGGVGAIITGAISVTADGRGDAYRPLLLRSDDDLPAYRALCEAAHDQGARVIAQLDHCGRQTRRGGCGPCALKDSVYKNAGHLHELQGSEITELIRRFAQAAARARQAGFDGVELSAAHGNLLSSFLSPRMNIRADDWGGDLEHRARAAVECARLIKALAGEDFPLIVKINGSERGANGTRPRDAARTAALLERAGADAIEVSCGTHEEGLQTTRGAFPDHAFFASEPELKRVPAPLRRVVGRRLKRMYESAAPWSMYNLPAARCVAEAVTVPVILTGGVLSLSDMRAALDAGMSFVALARPLLAQPGLVNALRAGECWSARCTQCNQCVAGLRARPTVCPQFRDFPDA